MKNVTREQWIAALESGEYTQGQGFLRRPDDDTKGYHCCLGVLDDIADAWEEQRGVSSDIGTYNIPKTVRDMVGITYDQALFLANLNDADAGFTFPQIAAILRADFTIPFIGKVA